MKRSLAWMAALCVAVVCGSVRAEGIFVPASSRVDMVHDAARDLVYIASSDGRVLRYQVGTGTFLSPIVLGGSLGGIDLSPDGNQLAVADRQSSSTQLWMHLVNLPTLTTRKLTAQKAFYEGGMWTVAYTAEGRILATSQFNGSGWVPMRSFNPLTRKSAQLASVRQDTMLAASSDRQTVAFAESNISDGRWGLYDVPTGRFVRRDGYTNGTSWFNYEIATDPMGSQFAVPTYGGTMIYNDVYQRVAVIGQYAAGQPVGAVYHPTMNRVYFPWAQSSEVRVYDTTTFQQVGAYDAEYVFAHTGNYAFGNGRIRIARDGSLLMVSVAGGVRLIRLDAGPTSARGTSKAAAGKALRVD